MNDTKLFDTLMTRFGFANVPTGAVTPITTSRVNATAMNIINL